MKIKKVQIREDGGFLVNDIMGVPADMGNRHRVMIQEWIDAGNTPSPYVGPTDMELCMEEIVRLESTITPRRMRDAVASVEGKTWLADIESKIAIERVKLNG